MKKQVVLSLALVLSSVFGSAATAATATENPSEQKLKETIAEIDSSNLSETAKAQQFFKAVDESTPTEQIEYFEEVGELVQNALTDIDTEVSENTEIDLGSGVTIELETEDISEGAAPGGLEETTDEEPTMSTSGYEYSPGNIITKEYGARKFTCTVSVKSVGVTLGSLVLANHYSVGDFGLKMRYATDTGTSGTEPLMVINRSSSSVVDDKAEKVGYDMNARGSYSWKLGVKGVYKSFTSEIYSTIKLDSLNKSKKTARITQNYKYTE